ncbi:NADH dehydrogenase [ubiquinone] 1 subunit C2 [Halyomorpha halys]|uniref:NADH dehydrogenase [ubiquinone] 1 subunit C2 n=1 Tax=Halyomorpha halys TaxID=286706 RepID=UPI0006D500F2|nr:NADH dehydrogenase [ubiquinone] 1 subunit C2 [Halyomorpha halys]
MAVVPDPQKLFLPDPDFVPPFWNGKFVPTFLTAVSFGSTCAHRIVLRQPVFSGIQVHLAFAAAGCGIGILLQRWYDNRTIEKDATYRHYIALHPEDFPMPERQKVGDIFPKFTPSR